jgi:hypothetical protein
MMRVLKGAELLLDYRKTPHDTLFSHTSPDAPQSWYFGAPITKAYPLFSTSSGVIPPIKRLLKIVSMPSAQESDRSLGMRYAISSGVRTDFAFQPSKWLTPCKTVRLTQKELAAFGPQADMNDFN